MNLNLFEAFEKLKNIDEDIFNTDKKDLRELDDFIHNDDVDNFVDIYDDEYEEDKDHLDDCILSCSVCHSKHYRNKNDIKLDEDTDLANVGEECPYCHSTDGYTIVGEIDECSIMDEDLADTYKYKNNIIVHNTQDDTFSVKGYDDIFETSADAETFIDTVTESLKKDVKDSLTESEASYMKRRLKDSNLQKGTSQYKKAKDAIKDFKKAEKDFFKRKKDKGFMELEDEKDKKVFNNLTAKRQKVDDLLQNNEQNESCSRASNDLTEDYTTSTKFYDDRTGDEVSFIDILKDFADNYASYGYLPTLAEFNRYVKVTINADPNIHVVEESCLQDTLKEASIDREYNDTTDTLNKLSEALDEVEVKTGDMKLEVSSNEDGKVTVSAEPTTEEKEESLDSSSEEVIKPVSIETKAEITGDELPVESEEDEEMPEFDEESFDDVAESYLRSLYENVDLYRTRNISKVRNRNKFIIEGIIRFKDKSRKPIKFVFENDSRKLAPRNILLGESLNTGNKKNSCKLFTTVRKNRLITEGIIKEDSTDNDRIKELLDVLDKSFEDFVESCESTNLKEVTLNEAVRLTSIPNVTRDAKHDFIDDGTRFSAYLYKNTIPITYSRVQDHVFITIAFHHLNDVLYSDYKNFPSRKIADEFNGVLETEFDPKKFEQNLEQAYQDIINFRKNVEVPNQTEVDTKVDELNRFCTAFKEEVQDYIKQHSMDILNLSEYQFKELKEYIARIGRASAESYRKSSDAVKREFLQKDMDALKKSVAGTWQFKYIKQMFGDTVDENN